MLVKTNAAALTGIDAILISVEVFTTRGAKFHLVGLPDNAVKESEQRIFSVLRTNEYHVPKQKIIINMAPADIRKEGAAYDLTLAIGIMAAGGLIPHERLQDYIIMGELSLDGTIKPIKGVLPIAIEARKRGITKLILPMANATEAAIVNDIEVFGVNHITEVVDFLNDNSELKKIEFDTRALFYEKMSHYPVDFSEVKGQQNVKRAIEIAVSGGHNIVMIGAPGSGKTMIARRIPTILPPLTLSESLETTKIHSIVGKLQEEGLITERPFRAPHHTISDVALVGGGSYPQPGEISLAHNGILFLDELPEFKRTVLEVLRQPLEDRVITISRSKYTMNYPANFMLVAAMNPCPCGYYNHPEKECVCSVGAIQKYLHRLSGPLLDRIDIHLEVTPVPIDKLGSAEAGETSAVIRNRVQTTRKIQEERYKEYDGIYTNSQITPALIDKYCQLDDASQKLLRVAMDKLKLSARAYHRILKVARTIADMETSEQVKGHHIAEAIQFRNLDKEGWLG
jgi:magnesium chelatase family protein